MLQKHINTKNFAAFARLCAALIITPFFLMQTVNAAPIQVAFQVVCDDGSLKLVFEQKVVATIQSMKGYAVDSSGKAEIKVNFAVASIKKKKEKHDETVGLAIATVTTKNGTISFFENRHVAPDAYEKTLTELIPQAIGAK
jgi:hypothetical protein